MTSDPSETSSCQIFCLTHFIPTLLPGEQCLHSIAAIRTWSFPWKLVVLPSVTKARFRVSPLVWYHGQRASVQPAGHHRAAAGRSEVVPHGNGVLLWWLNSTLFKRFRHSTVCFEEMANVTECSAPAAEPNQRRMVRTTQSSRGGDGRLVVVPLTAAHSVLSLSMQRALHQRRSRLCTVQGRIWKCKRKMLSYQWARNLLASTYHRARELTVNHLVQKCMQFIDSQNLRQKTLHCNQSETRLLEHKLEFICVLNTNSVEVQGHPVEVVSAAFCLQPRANAQQPIQTKLPQQRSKTYLFFKSKWSIALWLLQTLRLFLQLWSEAENDIRLLFFVLFFVLTHWSPNCLVSLCWNYAVLQCAPEELPYLP